MRGKLGITLNNNELFGNHQSIQFRYPDGSNETIDGRPINSGGCHGLVLYKDAFHLLSEDDGHYWTTWILKEDDINKLHTLLTDTINNIILKPNNKYSIKSTSRLTFTGKGFTSTIQIRSDAIPLIIITKEVSTNKLVFDCTWVSELLDVLDI